MQICDLFNNVVHYIDLMYNLLGNIVHYIYTLYNIYLVT